ncbi:MAG: SPASM domain-containing protein [Pseudomonadota bacterium]
MERFTLHMRMTKACNADCSYCSSWQEDPDRYMDAAAYAKAVDFIADEVLPLMGWRHGDGGHLSIQYVGGEIMLVPKGQLRRSVYYARDRFGSMFDVVTDGCQTNLIGSSDRIAALQTLFGHRLSTSVDNFGSQRTVKGSPALYRAMMNKSRKELKRRRGLNAPAIFVVDAEGLPNAMAEYEIAEREGYDLTLRAVFHGGKEVGAATVPELAALYAEIFDAWALKGTVMVQPLYQLLTTRLSEIAKDEGLYQANFGCPFQKNCAFVSLNLDPNGDLYVCLDMADSDQFKLGNAVEGRFEREVWEGLANRRDHFDDKCRSCKWLASCQGGCMSEAVHHTGSPYGRTELCTVWESVFSHVDALIEREGVDAVAQWCREIATPKMAPQVAAE